MVSLGQYPHLAERYIGNAMKKENSYTRIFKYTSLFGGVQGLNILIGLVRNKFVAVLLGPVGMGLISIYNTAAVFLQNATNFGIQTTGVREIAVAYKDGDDDTLRRNIRLLRSWSVVVAAIGFFITIACARFLSLWAFSSADYTWKFMCLAPIVALAALTGGETAILKGTRRLSQLARTSVYSVVAALVLSVPLYMRWGNDGIIPSLLLIAAVQMVLTMAFSYRFYPLRLTFGKELSAGRSMLAIGAAFVVAGIAGSGAEFIIRAFLSDMSLSLVGLYNTGYMITVTYAGMIFAAMETDYFPYLSSICHNTRMMNGAVNRQIEVSMVMVAPFLIVLMVALPLLIPLLFSSQFLPVIGMTQVAILAMYSRAVTLPVAYITLAKGDSRSYLLLELVCDVVLVTAVILGYYNWGLEGTGFALALTNILDCLCVCSFCRWRYNLALSTTVLRFILLQAAIGVVALVVVRLTAGPLYWLCGILLIAVSTALSYKTFIRHTHHD